MKAALDAALRFHTADETLDRDLVIETAKRFHRELATAAPGAAEDWDEEWWSRVNQWVQTLSGDQRGSVESALRNSAPVPLTPAYFAPPYGPVYTGPPQPAPQAPSAAWELLDKLNGPQPYPDPAARPWSQVMQETGQNFSGPAAAHRVPTPSDGPPTAVPGTEIRVRPGGADPYTTSTYVSQLLHGPEGFHVLVEPGAFSEGRRDEIQTESINALLKALKPAKLSGTIIQQVKELVGTVLGQRRRIRDLEESRKAFERTIRELVGAQDESGDDLYCPEQPTLDAVRRLVQRLVALDSAVDGSMPQSQLLTEIQQGWHDGGHRELQP